MLYLSLTRNTTNLKQCAMRNTNQDVLFIEIYLQQKYFIATTFHFHKKEKKALRNMVQCAGITNSDTQCSREGTSGGFCASGDKYCWQHVNQDPTQSWKRTVIFSWTCLSGIIDIYNAAFARFVFHIL